MFVAKLCPVEELGRFAVALAWAAPVMLAARMQLRSVLAADAQGRLPLGLAVQTRGLATAAALAVIAVLAFGLASPPTAWAVTLAALSRAAEDAGDLPLGLAQRAGAWPAIARSFVLHGVGGAAALGVALASGRGLLGAMGAALAWQLGVTLLHDWRVAPPGAAALEWTPWRAALGAARSNAALGGAAALVSLNAYVPRYAVERFLGLEAVGVYTALAQLALIGNLAVQAVGQAAVAPLGKAFHEDPRAFRARLPGLLAFAALAGGAGLIGAYAAGGWGLALLYTPEYARQRDTLVWLMAAAALTYITAILGYALVAAGERSAQLRIFAVSTAVSLAASLAATPFWGLLGAAAALLAAWAVAAAGAALALRRRLRACRPTAPSPRLSQWPSAESARPGGAR